MSGAMATGLELHPCPGAESCGYALTTYETWSVQTGPAQVQHLAGYT